LEAKDAYLDMLRHAEAWPEAFDAITQFRWPDTLPAVRAACDAPRTVQVYRHAYAALRALEGRPISPKIIAASAVLKELDGYQFMRGVAEFSEAEIASACDTILLDADRDAVVSYLLDMFVYFSSDLYAAHSGRLLVNGGLNGDNFTARELFEKLPRDSSAVVLQRLKTVVTDPAQAAYLARLHTLVSSAAPNTGLFSDRQLGEISSEAHRQMMHIEMLGAVTKRKL
jgi:hypothetical protein